MPRIGQAVVESGNDAHLGFGLPQQQDPRIRGEVAPCPVDQDGPALHRGYVEGKMALVVVRGRRYILHHGVPEWL